MLLLKRYFFLLLLLAGHFNAPAQDYAATLQSLKDKSTEAMNRHNLPLYLKLANEEYDLTSRHKDTAAMISASVKLVDYYTSLRLNNDSANFYSNIGLYWARLKKDIENEADLKYMRASQYANNGD